MGLIDIILNRKNVYKLRKEYDRIREKADKEPDMNKRFAVLHLLDSIEPTLVVLEEQILSNLERKRMINYVDQRLKKARTMLKERDYYKIASKEQSSRGQYFRKVH